MATAENAAKARLGKLKKQADELGITYHDDVTEETLKYEIKATKAALAELDSEMEVPLKPLQSAPSASGTDIAALGKTIAQEMAKAVQGIKDDGSGDRTVSERMADPEDAGEEKSYFVPMFFWILPAKRQGGQLVKAPFGKIVFKMSTGGVVRNGDQTNTVYKAIYSTNSKREQAYIETHPLFGRVFFANQKEAEISSEQLRFAQTFGKQMQMLNTKMAPELYRTAAENGVHVDATMSLNTLRTNIANALARRAMQSEDQHLRNLSAAAGRAELLKQPA